MRYTPAPTPDHHHDEDEEEEGGGKEYVPTDDDPIANDEGAWGSGGGGGTAEYHSESPDEMMHDRNVIILASTLSVAGLVAMLLVAQQVMHNPDGGCAVICRLLLRCLGCIFWLICMPCRAMCGDKGPRRHQLPLSRDDHTFAPNDLDLELT